MSVKHVLQGKVGSIPTAATLQETSGKSARGPRDKMLDYESRDWGFESLRAHACVECWVSMPSSKEWGRVVVAKMDPTAKSRNNGSPG